jgi:hypothetical protein
MPPEMIERRRKPVEPVLPPPPPRGGLATFLSSHPRVAFVLLCVAAGTVVGMLWTMAREDPAPERGSPVAAMEPPAAELPEPANTATPAPADRPASPARAPAPPPPRPVGLLPEDIDAVIERLSTGKPYERDEAERFLIWHGDKTSGRVRAALQGALGAQARASLLYVTTAIEEERSGEAREPFVTNGPPQRGLVLFCDSLDGRIEDIAVMRRTAKAAGLEATLVLAHLPDAAGVLRSRAAELGDVTVFLDPDGALVKQMRIERLPTLAGLREDGRPAFLVIGPVQRARLADQIPKIVK